MARTDPTSRRSVAGRIAGKGHHSILVALPPADSFTPAAADAISLFVRDTCLHSRYREALTIYGPDRPRSRLFNGLHFHGLKKSWSDSFSLFKATSQLYVQHLLRERREPSPRLIEVHNDVMVFQTLTKRYPGASAIFYLHQDPVLIPQLSTPKQRWQFLNQASIIVCSSDYVRRRFLTGLEAARTDHVRVVYHGGLTPHEPIYKEPFILCVGRIIPEKGIMDTIQAAHMLLPHYPNWRLVIVGSTPTKPTLAQKNYMKTVHDALKRLGRQAAWLDTQPHDKLQQLYARAAISIVPSLVPEPVGRTAIEALVAGSALVSSGMGALYEILGNSGVVVDPVTPQGLALALQGLIEDPTTLAGVQDDCLFRGETFSMMHSCQQIDQLRHYLMSDSYVAA